MYELTLQEIEPVSGGIRLEEAALGMAALGGVLVLGPFMIAAGVAFGGAILLEGMYADGM